MPRPAGTVFSALTFLFALGAAALAAEAAPSLEVGSSLESPTGPEGTASCAVTPDQVQSKPRVRRGVLGWLYRYTRNIDIERSGGAPQPFILRSPLLTAAPDRSDCEDVFVAPPRAEACAVVAVNPGSEKNARTVTVPLPQYHAATARMLEAEIRDRLMNGETVVLRTLKGVELRLDGGVVRFVVARTCRTDV